MPRGVAMAVSRAWAAAVPAAFRPASSFSAASRGGRNGAQRREQLVQFAEATRGAVAAPPSAATLGSPTATVPVTQPAADPADPAKSSPSFSRWSAANCSPTTRERRRRAVSSFLEATRADLANTGAGDAALTPTATTYAGVSEAAPPPVTATETDGRGPAPDWVDSSARAAPAWIDRDGNIRAEVLAHLAFSYGAFSQENAHAHREGRQAAVKHFMDATRGSNSGAVIPPPFDPPTDASKAWWRGRRRRQHLASASA